jgi:predicted ATPase
MIAKFSIQNFKSLRDVRVDLERFTVFVGPNASGKSSILQALNLLCSAFHQASGMQPFGGLPMQIPYGGHPVQNVEGELTEALSRGANDPVEVAAEASGRGFRYQTRSPHSPPQPFQHLQTKWDGSGCGTTSAFDSSDWKSWKLESGRTAPLPSSVLLRLEASKLVQPNSTSADASVMTPEGSGLHSALANMALNDPDSWKALQEDLRGIIPTIRRLRHTKAATPHQPTSLLFDTVGADSLPATQVSEGTLLVLGLLAALYASDRPNLLLLDDLDRGLHPKAQKELLTLLRRLLATNPDLQIVATTHSPYMLDSMETNEVRMTFLRDDGATVCQPLSSHPKYPKWKDEMTPGEMWSLFGEKWLVGTEAAAP